MENLELNKNMGQLVEAHGYKLSGTKKYVIDFEKELPEQAAILESIRLMGLEATNDWFSWLESNGFSTEMPNPTNSFVEQFYGKEPLWKTNLSQGIVVKEENEEEDYFIIMECSRENEGFKYTQVVLTPGGCF